MPVFFQHRINEHTRLGIWKIEETEEFFRGNVPLHRDVTHPHKRLQHLAGRFLLQFLFPDFPYEMIQIADTRKPFLADERYHFSISHCGDYAAAIVSRTQRVGIDIEKPVEKIGRIRDKFLNEGEKQRFVSASTDLKDLTLLWSAKESVFKWYGNGAVEFRDHILLGRKHSDTETIEVDFSKTGEQLSVHYREFEHLVLAFVIS